MDKLERTLKVFGIEDILSVFKISKSAKGWRVFTPELEEMPKTPNDTYGLLAVRSNGKPTSFFLRLFHKKVKKYVDVNLSELEALLNGEEIQTNSPVGWVLVKFKGIPIGCGLAKNGKLRLEIPKDDRNRFLAGLRNLRKG